VDAAGVEITENCHRAEEYDPYPPITAFEDLSLLRRLTSWYAQVSRQNELRHASMRWVANKLPFHYWSEGIAPR
jgi:hypothetical protein